MAHNLAHALPTPRTLAAALAHAKAPAHTLPRRAAHSPLRQRRLSRPRLASSPTTLATLRANAQGRSPIGRVARRHVAASHRAPIATAGIARPTEAHHPRKIRRRKATAQPARASCTGIGTGTGTDTSTGASSNTGATAHAQATRIRTASATTLSLHSSAANVRRPRSPRVAMGAIGQRTRGSRRVALPHSIGLLAEACGVVSCRSGAEWGVGECVGYWRLYRRIWNRYRRRWNLNRGRRRNNR